MQISFIQCGRFYLISNQLEFIATQLEDTILSNFSFIPFRLKGRNMNKTLFSISKQKEDKKIHHLSSVLRVKLVYQPVHTSVKWKRCHFITLSLTEPTKWKKIQSVNFMHDTQMCAWNAQYQMHYANHLSCANEKQSEKKSSTWLHCI